MVSQLMRRPVRGRIAMKRGNKWRKNWWLRWMKRCSGGVGVHQDVITCCGVPRSSTDLYVEEEGEESCRASSSKVAS